ncbi:hypothetical protein ACG2OD_23350 [Streptomyces sp. PDY-4]|uniref:hypothetical protein n=1 Tax=Streptomyces sp. PDY-4 TaxID=3376070 RepID=UPI00379AAD5C
MTTIIPDQPLPRRTESGMHTRAVNAAAGVLLAAMQQGRQTPTGLAIALDSAQLLQSPEHAARVAELEALTAQATEFRLWEPGYGLYVRRAPGATGFGVLEARRTDKGRRCWTTAGWQYSAVLSDTELFCWPDAQTAVAEARRVMPGATVCEPMPFEARPLTVYRASHDSIQMGLYLTAAAARAHCEAEERRANSSEATFDWIEDEEDGVAELVAETVLGEESTGYVVTALEVASAYNEEADE